MRRGSASSTSNSKSPRPGDDLAAARHAARTWAVTRPPIVSTSSASASVGEVEAERLRDFVERRARLDEEGAVGAVATLGRSASSCSSSMSPTIDLDDVLDRDEPVGAAIFVDHQRHMGARRLHLHQQVERRHRGRHEQHRPQDRGAGQRHRHADLRPRQARARASTALSLGREPEARLGRQKVDEIADVDHAARIVERFAVDRQARMAGGAEQRSTSLSGVSAATAMMSARGTMTSATRTSCRPSTFLRIARSCGVKSASSAASSSASSISSRTEPGPRPSSARRRSNRPPPWTSF